MKNREIKKIQKYDRNEVAKTEERKNTIKIQELVFGTQGQETLSRRHLQIKRNIVAHCNYQFTLRYESKWNLFFILCNK